MLLQWLAVALGGAFGASCRFGLALLFPAGAQRWPVATFIANGLGSLLFGFLFFVIMARLGPESLWRSFLLVGLLGALTTFSTFAFEAYTMLQNGELLLAVSYCVSSVVVAIMAVALGHYLAQFIF